MTHSRWTGCSSAGCRHTGCQVSATAHRARRIRRRVGGLTAWAWGVVVLTVPRNLRHLVSRENWRAMHLAAWRTVESWYRSAAGAWGVGVGGAVVAHPEGDSEPGAWAPHFNVVFPLAVRSAKGWTRIYTWQVKRSALDALRETWRVALGGILGFDLMQDVVVHYSYRATPAKIAHAFRYNFRVFGEWEAWTHRPRWFGALRAGAGHPGADPFGDGCSDYREDDEDAQGCPWCDGSAGFDVEDCKFFGAGRWWRRADDGEIEACRAPPGEGGADHGEPENAR